MNGTIAATNNKIEEAKELANAISRDFIALSEINSDRIFSEANYKIKIAEDLFVEIRGKAGRKNSTTVSVIKNNSLLQEISLNI